MAGRLAVSVIERFHIKSMKSRRPYWCPKTMKRRPCLCPKPVLWELNSFLMQTLSFVQINLHRGWPPREWKHSIVGCPYRGGGGGVINGCPRDCRGHQTIRLSARRWLTVYQERSPSIKILTFLFLGISLERYTFACQSFVFSYPPEKPPSPCSRWRSPELGRFQTWPQRHGLWQLQRREPQVVFRAQGDWYSLHEKRVHPKFRTQRHRVQWRNAAPSNFARWPPSVGCVQIWDGWPTERH